MEEKIITALDGLSLDQTDELLQKDTELKISRKEMRRIKNMVYRKTGFHREKRIYRLKKAAVCMAAAAMAFVLLSLAGVDRVANAASKLFSFIPGFGIIENNKSITCILSQPVSAENDRAVISIDNAVATKNSITIMFKVKPKNGGKQPENSQKKNEDTISHPKVILCAGEHRITDYTGGTGCSETCEISTFCYTLRPEDIGTGKAYVLEDADYGLKLRFTLKDYNYYRTLEEIGATGYHNNIFVTAVPTFLDGKVQVDLYTVNKSSDTIDSFCKVDKTYHNADLRLETNSGVKTYTVPDGYSGLNGRFTFDIGPNDRNFTLKIPYLTVESSESKNIALPIPQEGKKAAVNQRIEFNDCTMTIVDAEKTLSRHIGNSGELKMTVKYGNKSADKIMLHPLFERTDFFGNVQSGSWSAEEDENGVYTTVYFALNPGESGKLRLKVSRPVYVLTDEYQLTFHR